MAQPWQQRSKRRRRLLVLAALLVLLCLARHGGAASAASSSTHRKDGAAVVTAEKPAGAGRDGAASGFAATTNAEGELPARMEMEVDVQDYPGANANARHDFGYPRGPQHP